LCRKFPIDHAKHVFVVNPEGGYEGYIDLAEAHRAEADHADSAITAGQIARGANQFLTPGQPVRETLDVFTSSNSDTLAVVDNSVDRRIQGYLSEAFAMRRYYRELEARHREELGDEDMFSSALGPHDG
jgi:CIC family chloride channel protein